jgi:ADP-ribose pyrophosphatase YjhB (NUDIX family)
MDFQDSYLGQLRAIVGAQLLIVPGGRVIPQNSLGEILLQERSDFQQWALPGGAPEVGESIEDNLRRELLEELNIQVHSFIPIGFSSNPEFETITYPNGDRIHNYSLILLSTKWTGDIYINAESLQARFFTLNDLPNVMLPDQRILAYYQQYQVDHIFRLFQ